MSNEKPDPAGCRVCGDTGAGRGGRVGGEPRRNARIAVSSTRSIATRTTIWSPIRRPIRRSGRTRPRSSSPTRRSRIPAVYQNVFKPFTDFLNQCTGKRVVYYPVQSNSAEIEAMRSGRLHVAGFSTGPTGFAVNLAGAVPFAAKGTEKGPHGYRSDLDRARRTVLTRSSPISRASASRTPRRHRTPDTLRRSCSIRPRGSSRTRTTSR